MLIVKHLIKKKSDIFLPESQIIKTRSYFTIILRNDELDMFILRFLIFVSISQ